MAVALWQGNLRTPRPALVHRDLAPLVRGLVTLEAAVRFPRRAIEIRGRPEQTARVRRARFRPRARVFASAPRFWRLPAARSAHGPGGEILRRDRGPGCHLHP